MSNFVIKIIVKADDAREAWNAASTLCVERYNAFGGMEDPDYDSKAEGIVTDVIEEVK